MAKVLMTRRFFVSLLLLVILCITTVQAGINVQGAKYMGNLSPGETIVHTIGLSLGQKEEETDVSLDIMGFGNSAEGSYVPLFPEQDVSPYSARTFITLEKNKTHLKPGQSEPIAATITIPKNVGGGGRYAIIHIATPPKPGGTVSLSVAVNVPILITIAITEITQTGKITDLKVIEPKMAGESTRVVTTLQNTGNHHYYDVVTEIQIKDKNGNLVYTGISEPEPFAIIPTQSVQLEHPINAELAKGSYIVTSKVSVNKTILLDEKNTTFEIKKAYIPPFSETDITVKSGSSTILEPPEGRVRVTFLQGAILEDTKVYLKPVTQDNLPDIPPEVKPAATFFSIEGITGLLAKDATITVKYTADDLQAAGGNPSKLVLARWNRGTNKWSFLRTTLDTNAGTISTTTNHLSTWAVMVAEGPITYEETRPSGMETKIPGFTVLVACGALAIVILMAIRRRVT